MRRVERLVPPTIMGSHQKRDIGKTYKGMSDKDRGNYPDQPYTVLREATLEEWIAFAEAEVGRKLTAREIAGAEGATFYEIATD